MHDYHSYIKDATEMRNSESCDKRDMKVHWITGCSGGGKSAFAQFLAHEKYEDTEIAMGAEGDHMFDGYDLQPCFIMDEFRGSDMKFKSYLQLTDNHINSKMGARYHNVDFRNCKDMYITSIRTPEQCYMGMLNDGAEPRYQAYRRLGFQYYEIQITNYKEGQVCLVETENSDDTPEKVFRKTIVYKVKYSKDGAPEFIKLDEPIVVEGF